MAKVEIISHDGKTNILIDGRRVSGVVGYELSQDAYAMPKLILDIAVRDLKIITDAVTEKNDAKSFK